MTTAENKISGTHETPSAPATAPQDTATPATAPPLNATPSITPPVNATPATTPPNHTIPAITPPVIATSAATPPVNATPATTPPVPAAPPDPAAPLAASFGKYGLVSLAAGIFYSFCFYKNPSGITWPFFTAVIYALLYKILPELGIRIKKDSCFLAGTALLLSLSMCLTSSGFFHIFNRIALFLLLAIFLIHQFYEDLAWNIGKYMGAVIQYICVVIGTIPTPFAHAAQYTKTSRNAGGKNFLIAAAGVCASIPFALIVILLLGDADAVFAQIVLRLFNDIFNFRTLLAIIFETLAAAIIFYCILCSRYTKTISEQVKDHRKGNPFLAVSFLAILVLAYLLFCGIQVYYLFLRQGTLPESMTYAQYAHQGFFQLVFVVFFNLVLVLFFLKFFKKSGPLRFTLTVISSCTCIMILSAAYRMILYVSTYHLTFLRLLVLWFLAMTAVLMAGIFRLIYRESFPLFRYCVVVVSVFYTCFALALPDAIIARYNLTTGSPLNFNDYFYLRTLSADAAPALSKYLPDSDPTLDYWDGREEYLVSFCQNKTRSSQMAAPDDPNGIHTIRSYNFSAAKALKINSEAGR